MRDGVFFSVLCMRTCLEAVCHEISLLSERDRPGATLRDRANSFQMCTMFIYFVVSVDPILAQGGPSSFHDQGYQALTPSSEVTFPNSAILSIDGDIWEF